MGVTTDLYSKEEKAWYTTRMAKGSNRQGQAVGKLTRISMISQPKKFARLEAPLTFSLILLIQYTLLAPALQHRQSAPEHCHVPCVNA